MIRQAISPRLAIRIRLNIPCQWPQMPDFSLAASLNRSLHRSLPDGATGGSGLLGVTIVSCSGRIQRGITPIRIGRIAMSVRLPALLYAVCAVIPLHIASAQAQSQRNLILFVPDGLRALSVTPEETPAMAAVRDRGVNFANPHSLFPTFTMANASG